MAWRASFYPELKYYKGVIARQGAISRCSTRIFRNRKMLLGYVLMIVAGIGLPIVLWLGFDYFLFDWKYGSFVYGLCIMVPFVWLTRNAVRREMRIELRQSNLPICIQCGYDLVSIENTKCPECGIDNYSTCGAQDAP